MKDPIKDMKHTIKVNIDFILKEKTIDKKTIDKVGNIILPSITVFSHRVLKFGNHSGLQGHATRKTIRKELGEFMGKYLRKIKRDNQLL